MKEELILQLKVILPLTALILFALMAWRGMANAGEECTVYWIGGRPVEICWPTPD